MADPHFETLLTDCLGQFWKADMVNFSRAPKLTTGVLSVNAWFRQQSQVCVLQFPVMPKRLIVPLLIMSIALAADSPKRIEQKAADQNLINKVEPMVPPLAKTLEIGSTVALDITISPEGKVSSVTALSGHPMLTPAFVDAVKKWEYKPFLKDGHPIAVVTKVEWSVPSASRTNTERKR
jgi:TonB family protein